MGRKKRRQTVFATGTCKPTDDDEFGGLHIGGVVITRAPLSARRAAQAEQRHTAQAGHSRQQQQQQQHDLQDAELSENSLDGALRDYLNNIEQDARGSSNNYEEQQVAGSSHHHASASAASSGLPQAPAAADPTAGSQQSNSDGDWEDADDGSDGGSDLDDSVRPGIGFQSAAAAARFARTRLEGLVCRDPRPGDSLAGSISMSNSGSDSWSDSDSSDSEADSTEHEPTLTSQHGLLGLQILDANTSVPVDSSGQCLAFCEQLPVQQRHPVQACQQVELTSQDGRYVSRPQRQQQRRTSVSRRNKQESGASTADRSGYAAAVAAANLPKFLSKQTEAAATAAYQSALAASSTNAAEACQQKRQQQTSVAKGARNGQLLPGEKKKLRKEKIAAKRAVREAGRGLDALQLLQLIEQFVVEGRDMEVLPPCSKHMQALARSIAAVFGVDASARGSSSSSSGKTASLVLQATASTGSPETEQQQQQLVALLTRQLMQQFTAEAAAAGPGPKGAAAKQQQPGAGQQGTRSVACSHRRGSRSTPGKDQDSIYQQPVTFVSAGVVDVNSSNSSAEAAIANPSLVQDPSRAVQTANAEPNLSAVDSALQQQQASGSAAVSIATAAASIGAGAEAAACLVMVPSSAGLLLANALEAAAPAVADCALVPPSAAGRTVSAPQGLGCTSPAPQQQQQLDQSVPAPMSIEQHIGWAVDRQPWFDPPAHPGLGFVAPDQNAACIGGPGSSTTGVAAADTLIPGSLTQQQLDSAPAYDRAPIGLGFRLRFRTACTNTAHAALVQSAFTDASGPIGQPSTTQQHVASSSRTSSKQSNQKLQELEQKFNSLRTFTNPAAQRRQQRFGQSKQQQQQRQQQQQGQTFRLTAPNTAVGPDLASLELGRAAVSAGQAGDSSGQLSLSGSLEAQLTAGLTLGLTAQQIKKARKQQQRNQRREARAAAAGDDTVITAPASTPAAAAGAGMSLGFAHFEAHTTGIGSRLMASWGWVEGQGLGRARQGRPEPLQAARRPKQLGLGAE